MTSFYDIQRRHPQFNSDEPPQSRQRIIGTVQTYLLDGLAGGVSLPSENEWRELASTRPPRLPSLERMGIFFSGDYEAAKGHPAPSLYQVACHVWGLAERALELAPTESQAA